MLGHGSTLGLSIAGDRLAFERVTKRGALIADTMLLTNDWSEPLHARGKHTYLRRAPSVQLKDLRQLKLPGPTTGQSVYAMHCVDLGAVGRWILDARPLLESGLAWYLPGYSESRYEAKHGVSRPLAPAMRVKAIDYLISDGRAVDASGAEPIKSQLVRPVLEIELPFIDGVGLRDFSKITVDEFASYAAFRDFLRLQLLNLDSAMNAVEADRALAKLALEIKDQVRASRAEMERTSRKRLLVASGAALGTIGAALVAVYGPALQAAVATAGASGGVWAIIQGLAENSTRELREDKWHYVWVLSKNERF